MIGLQQPQTFEFSRIVIQMMDRTCADHSTLIHDHKEESLSLQVIRLQIVNVTQFAPIVKLLQDIFEGRLPLEDAPRY